MNSTVVYIDTPYLTIEEYGRRAGLTKNSVVQRIKKGLLPVVRLSTEPGKRGSVMVNNALLIKEAMAQEEWRNE